MLQLTQHLANVLSVLQCLIFRLLSVVRNLLCLMMTTQDPQFRPEFSKSYQSIHCGEADCTGTCDRKQQCRYSRHYAEQSSSSGLLGRDLVGFGNDSLLTPRPILFGCETVETGGIYWQQADGIMGLGRGALSIVDQLTDQGAIANSFSLCYGGMEEAGGAMILGAVPPLQGTVFTPSNPYRRFSFSELVYCSEVSGENQVRRSQTG